MFNAPFGKRALGTAYPMFGAAAAARADHGGGKHKENRADIAARALEIAFETTVPLACGAPSPPGRWAALPFEITQQTLSLR